MLCVSYDSLFISARWPSHTLIIPSYVFTNIRLSVTISQDHFHEYTALKQVEKNSRQLEHRTDTLTYAGIIILKLARITWSYDRVVNRTANEHLTRPWRTKNPINKRLILWQKSQ